MVNNKNFLESIYFIYYKFLRSNIRLLIVGGSIGRGNYVDGWSDADLLLVLKNVDSQSLRLVRKCEDYLGRRFGILIDTMITSQFTFEHTAPEKLHGKIKNFLFFFNKEEVLVKKGNILPIMNHEEFGYGFWATYAEQEKNFFRRNADMSTKNKQALVVLAKKNIKIIFLLLKQFFAISREVPENYEEILNLADKTLPKYIYQKLRKYKELRDKNKLSELSTEKLKKLIEESVELFGNIGKIVNKETIYEKRNRNKNFKH